MKDNHNKTEVAMYLYNSKINMQQYIMSFIVHKPYMETYGRYLL